jgi:Tfp pilus assembly protein PilF
MPSSVAHRGRPVELLKRAVELDPNYARAHAALGYAYAWTAVFIEDKRRLVDLARQEIAAAAQLDPRLALTHEVRAFLLWSQCQGWQVEAAIRELKAAQQLDAAVGRGELADY